MCLGLLLVYVSLCAMCQGFNPPAFAHRVARPSALHFARRAINLDLAQVFRADKLLDIYNEQELITGVYAVEGKDEKVKFVGVAFDVVDTLRKHLARHGPDQVYQVRVQTFPSYSDATSVMAAYRDELIKKTKPLGNLSENDWDNKLLDSPESPFAASQGNEGSVLVEDQVKVLNIRPEGGAILGLTKENVDKVLDEVRPYLIADGGNVSVVSIDEKSRSISLLLQGACGSCASSTTTMKMGIERVLKENFSNLGPVISVDPQSMNLLTVEMVQESLSKIMPAIKGMGGLVEVRSTDTATGTVLLSYKGPAKLRQGIELVLKDIALIKNVIVENIDT